MSKKLFQKILILILAVSCLLLIKELVSACLGVLPGRVVVTRVMPGRAGEKVLLNGAGTAETPYYTLPEQIFFKGEISGSMRAGVTAMAFVRSVPLVLCGVGFFLFLLRAFRDEIFSLRNARLFLCCGVLYAAAALLVPLINGRLIPALVNAASGQSMEVGVNLQWDPRLYKGLVLLFMSCVLYKGAGLKEEAKQWCRK